MQVYALNAGRTLYRAIFAVARIAGGNCERGKMPAGLRGFVLRAASNQQRKAELDVMPVLNERLYASRRNSQEEFAGIVKCERSLMGFGLVLSVEGRRRKTTKIAYLRVYVMFAEKPTIPPNILLVAIAERKIEYGVLLAGQRRKRDLCDTGMISKRKFLPTMVGLSVFVVEKRHLLFSA